MIHICSVANAGQNFLVIPDFEDFLFSHQLNKEFK